MRVLLAHNRYQLAGGEDAVFAAERALLRERGHEILEHVEDNHHIADMNRFKLAASTVWSRDSYQKFRSVIQDNRPDVVHFHNTFPLISPAAYAACKREGVAVVQTIHNYRLFCPSAVCFRDGHPCEECLGRSLPWPGILHACYRGSRTQTAVVVTMLAAHRLRRTWQHDVDVYVALTNFARQKLIAGGLRDEQIVVKPNFLHPDPGQKRGKGEFFLFVGRLTEDKGIRSLIAAWATGHPAAPLHIAGDGPMAEFVAAAAGDSPNIHYLGRLSRSAVMAQMHAAHALLFPSVWYESFPVTIVEAFACGLPVIASRFGAMAEIIDDRRTGLLFSPGDSRDLVRQIIWAERHPGEIQRMGEEARGEYLKKYSAEENYHLLIDIYQAAIHSSASGAHQPDHRQIRST